MSLFRVDCTAASGSHPRRLLLASPTISQCRWFRCRRALIHRVPLCRRRACACERCSSHFDAWWPMRAHLLGLDSFEVMGSTLRFAGLDAVSQIAVVSRECLLQPAPLRACTPVPLMAGASAPSLSSSGLSATTINNGVPGWAGSALPCSYLARRAPAWPLPSLPWPPRLSFGVGDSSTTTSSTQQCNACSEWSSFKALRLYARPLSLLLCAWQGQDSHARGAPFVAAKARPTSASSRDARARNACACIARQRRTTESSRGRPSTSPPALSGAQLPLAT